MRKFLTLLLTAALLLTCCSGCLIDISEYVPEETADETEDTEETAQSAAEQAGLTAVQTLLTESAADQVFSLNYDPGAGLDPFTCTDTGNLMICSLLYDTFYELDQDFTPASRFVTQVRTEDYQWWYFTIDTTQLMQDGEPVTAADVAYSLRRAQVTSFSSRLADIYGVTAYDRETLIISTYAPNSLLERDLIFPVIREGSAAEPVGAGPYRLDEGCLLPFADHPHADSLPLEVIYLKEYDTATALIQAFENSLVDLVVNDPLGTSPLGYHAPREVHYVTTTNMHYIGFNLNSTLLKNDSFRAALTYGLDRSSLVTQALESCCLASALPIHPAAAYYDSDLNASLGYDPDTLAQVLEQMGCADYDNDGWLELMTAGVKVSHVLYEINLDFIVCATSDAKLAAAQAIAEDLAQVGIQVTVRPLPWEDYLAALEAGDFDLYYAEVRLTADFDVTRLLSGTAGEDGSLNYGGCQDDTCLELIGAYLAAGDLDRADCASAMCSYLAASAPFAVIGFEQSELLTHRGVVSGSTPTQYNIFHRIWDWTVTQ